MLFSFFIYLTAAFLMFQWGKLCVPASGVSLKQQAERNFLGQFLFIATFVFIAGARFNVGVDYMSYLSIYEDYAIMGHTRRETLEPLFVYISLFLGKNGFHYCIYFSLWAFIQIFFVVKAVKHERELLPYIGAFIFLHSFFLNWMNGIRQCIVECVFFWALLFVKQKKLLIYLLVIYICSFMHTSAYFLMPLCLLSFFNISPKYRKLLLILIIACTIIGNVPSWIQSLSSLENILGAYGFETYAETLNTQIENEDLLKETAWGPSRIAIFLISCIIIWYAPKIKEQIQEKTSMFSIYFSLFVIGSALYGLFANTTHIFLRPIDYFTFFSLPMLAYTALYFWRNKKYIMFYVLLTLSFLPTVSAVIKGAINPTTTTSLYHFFFMM